MTEIPHTETECLYLGQRVLADGKVVEAWMPAGSSEELVSYFAPTPKAASALLIGGIYSLPAIITDGTLTSTRMARREYLRRHQDDADLARWAALDSAAKMKARSAQQLAKLKTQHPLEQDLLALRAHWHRLPAMDRTAFELTVLTFIRRRN